jgi:hypothetical protein
VVADLRVKDPSITAKELGSRTGYNPQTIGIWLRRPDYQRYENWVMRGHFEVSITREREAVAVQTRVRERLEECAPEMLDRLIEIAETIDDPKVQAQIAQDLLDRAGHGALKHQMKSGLAMIMTEEMLMNFALRAREAGLVGIVEGEVVR